jgi:hypothetical protein
MAAATCLVYPHVRSMKIYKLLRKPEQHPTLWEGFAGNGGLHSSSRCVKE